MTALATKVDYRTSTHDESVAMKALFSKLDEAIDDMEHGRVQTIEEAWKEIDAI